MIQERDDEESTTMEPHHITTELQSIVFLLQGLYGQFLEERKIVTMASGQMLHAVKQFQTHLQQFEAFETASRQLVAERIQSDLKEKVQIIAQEIGRAVVEIAYQPIQENIDTLARLTRDMEIDHRQEMREKQRLNRWKFLWIACSASIGGLFGGLVLYYYMFKGYYFFRV